jgi:hypothetical protein
MGMVGAWVELGNPLGTLALVPEAFCAERAPSI